jgi:hypothetical protein
MTVILSGLKSHPFQNPPQTIHPYSDNTVPFHLAQLALVREKALFEYFEVCPIAFESFLLLTLALVAAASLKVEISYCLPEPPSP